jgi:hypothetical protein
LCLGGTLEDVGSEKESGAAQRSPEGRRTLTPEEFFAGSEEGWAIYRAVLGVVSQLGPVEVRTTRSQVAFRAHRGFAYLWRPQQYVRSTYPAVLSIALRRECTSPRFKSVVRPAPGTWMHHLEVRSSHDVDAEVATWLAEANDAASRDSRA